jgi:hypothetical protein
MKRKGDHVLVMGMTAWEYASNERPEVPIRSYIQYVDTTSLYRPRKLQGSLTRSVLSGYLRYCREVIKVPFVHLFASAKPSLLFAESELLPRKKVLDSAILVNWWLAVMQTTFMGVEGAPAFVQESYVAPRGFVYCPGEENMLLMTQTIKQNLEALNRLDGIKWTYGLPYDQQESYERVPLFDDDPKFRHYEASLETAEERPAKRQRREINTTTVGVFFSSLALRIEFRQDPSALIAIHFPENVSNGTVIGKVARKGELASFSCKLLDTMKFGTEGDALKSSMRMWSWLKIMGSNPIELNKDHDAENSDDGVITCESDQRFHEIGGHLVTRTDFLSSALAVTDVQTLIRRKLPPRS